MAGAVSHTYRQTDLSDLICPEENILNKVRLTALITSVIMLAALLFSGCSGESGDPVAVQSVAMIAGIGNVGFAERFGGIVSARNEIKVKADQQKTIKEVFVEEGDEVSVGDILFEYDMELAELDLEKADLELSQMKNTLSSKKSEKSTLEAEKAKASEANKVTYTLAIQECDAEIREQEYKIAVKEKEVARLEESLETQDMRSEVDGRIKKINNNASGGEYSYVSSGSSDDAFITIVEAGSYRVMGYVNENNAAQLSEGLEVTIRSRVSDQTWSGHISEIDWANPQSGNNYGGMIYMEDSSGSDMTASSKYPFYVELDDSEGLLLGQHVFIEPKTEEADTEEIIVLPEYYLVEAEGDTAYVWAENDRNKLEKRKVSIIVYDIDMGMYQIESGLTADDHIAFPDESLKEGLPCQEFDDVIPQDAGNADMGGMVIPEGEYYDADLPIAEDDMSFDDGLPYDDEMQYDDEIQYDGLPENDIPYDDELDEGAGSAAEERP